MLVPPSTNPFLALRSQLAKSVTYKAPKSADPLLILGSVLLAIVSGIFVAGFMIRWRRGTLWLYRVVRAGSQSYILGSMLSQKGGFDAITSISEFRLLKLCRVSQLTLFLSPANLCLDGAQVESRRVRSTQASRLYSALVRTSRSYLTLITL